MQDSNAESAARLDRYSSVFIPAWLKSIASAQLPVHQIQHDEGPAVEELAGVLFPTWLMRGLEQRQLECAQSLAPTAFYTPIKVPKLSETTYAKRFLPLLREESRATKEQLAAATMYGVPLKPLDSRLFDIGNLDADKAAAFYELEARSIREGFPPVAISDLVLLKQVRWSEGVSQWCSFEAEVFSIRRAAGIVVLRCDMLRGMEESMSFVVSWMPQIKIFKSAHLGVTMMHMALNSMNLLPLHSNIHDSNLQTSSLRCAQSWLFPGKNHLLNYTSDKQEDPAIALDFINPALNAEQKEAVTAIVHGNRSVPFLISGVPGSGKTMTLAEAVLQILEHQPNANILLCGASHPSADTLTRRLAPHLNKDQMLRLIDPSRPIQETSSLIYNYCSMDDKSSSFTVPPLAKILSYRVLVVTVSEANLLVKYHATNSSLQLLTQNILAHNIIPGTKIKTADNATPVRPHWTHLLVDEAGQIHEPDSVIPLSIMLPLTDKTRTLQPPQIVLCGDVMQLGPEIFSDQARELDLDCSLLGRLLERPIYAEHPEARKNAKIGSSAFSESVDSKSSRPFVNLIRNYRSSPGILAPLANMFYSDSLVPCAPPQVTESKLLDWHRLPRKGFPLAVFGMDAPEEWTDEGESWYSLGEVDKVAELIVSLLKFAQTQKIHLAPSEISVVSPFRENVWRLRLKLRKLGLFDVDVGNVEALQGAENRVVILSTVRSQKRFLENDMKRGRGLYHEARRLCVALSRAKEIQIVVGNAQLLFGDPWWQIILRYAVRQECYSGPALPIADDDGGLTYLETRFGSLYGDTEIGSSEDETATRLAHGLANSALV